MRRLFALILAIAIFTGSAQAVQYPPGSPPGSAPDTLSIRNLQDATAVPHPAVLDTVYGVGGIITGFDAKPTGFGFYLQHSTSGAVPTAFTGVFVFTGTTNYNASPFSLQSGDSVVVYGKRQEFPTVNGGTEIEGLDASQGTNDIIVRNLGSGFPLPPLLTSTVNALREPASNTGAESWEGMLVRIPGPLRVARTVGLGANSFLLVDGAVAPPAAVDSVFVDGNTLTTIGTPALGTIVDRVQGIFEQRARGYRIQLRDGNDLLLQTPPNLVDAYPLTESTIRVRFDRSVTAASATTTTNYALGSFGSVDAAVMDGSDNVVLTVSGAADHGLLETVTVFGVVSTSSGLPMTTPQSRSFVSGVLSCNDIQLPNPDSLVGVPCVDKSRYAGGGGQVTQGLLGPRVSVTGVVTAVYGSLVYLADEGVSGQRHGLTLFAPPAQMVSGRRYLVVGQVQGFFGETELSAIVDVRDLGSGLVPSPTLLSVGVAASTLCDASQTLSTGRDYLSMLIRLSAVKVTTTAGAGGDFRVAGPAGIWSDTLLVSNRGGAYTFTPSAGSIVTVTGTLGFGSNAFRLQPRSNADLSVVFHGHDHHPVGSGSVSLNGSGDTLLIASLSPSGSAPQSGVDIDLGMAAMGLWTDLNIPRAPATGDSIVLTAHGDLSGVPNQDIARLKIGGGPGVVRFTPDFTPIGSATYDLELQLRGTRVGYYSGRSGLAFYAPTWPRQCDWLWLIWARLHWYIPPIDFGVPLLLTVPGQPPVVADRVLFLPQNPTNATTMANGLRITAAGVPSIRIGREHANFDMQTPGQLHNASIAYLMAHLPAGASACGRWTRSTAFAVVDTLARYALSVGYDTLEVSTAVDSLKRALDTRGFTYTQGPSSYFGVQMPSDSIPPSVLRRLHVEGGLSDTAHAALLHLLTIAENGTPDAAVLDYANNVLPNKGVNVGERVSLDVLSNVFTESHAYWSGPTAMNMRDRAPTGVARVQKPSNPVAKAIVDALGGAIATATFEKATVGFGTFWVGLVGELGATFASSGFSLAATSAGVDTIRYTGSPHRAGSLVRLDALAGNLRLWNPDGCTVGSGWGTNDVQIDIGPALSFMADFEPIDPGGSAAIGAALNARAFGVMNALPNQPLGTLAVTKTAAAAFSVAADFTSIAAPTQRIVVLNGGTTVTTVSGHTGIAAIANRWPRRIGKLGGPLECFVGGWPVGTQFLIDGNPFIGDELRVLAEGSPNVIGFKSRFDFNPAGLSELRIAAETSPTLATDVEPVAPPPVTFALAALHPNPVRDALTIRFDVPRSGRVEIVVLDVAGRKRVTLVDEAFSAGRYQTNTSAARRHLAAGMYFVRATLHSEQGEQSSTRRLIVLP